MLNAETNSSFKIFCSALDNFLSILHLLYLNATTPGVTLGIDPDVVSSGDIISMTL